MANRNFSLVDYFNQRGQDITPSMIYRGGDFESWQGTLRNKVLELLGAFPPTTELQPETIWRVEEDGFIKERVIFDTETYASVPAIVIRRADLAPDVRHPGILCIHGHGPHGKHSVAGVRISPDHTNVIEQHNYDYALQLAEAGFVTISPDLRNFGERASVGLYPGRDSCNVHFIRGLLLGINLITLNLWDLMKTLDYFSARPDVDAERIGCIGLSLGGTTTLHLAAIEPRIKAAAIVCALSTYEEYAIKMANFCGSQFIPGIYQYADLADLAGLIAPRPLLIESGIYDDGFPIESCLAAYEHLSQIYGAAGAEDRLLHDVFEGGHEFSGRKAFSFFEQWL